VIDLAMDVLREDVSERAGQTRKDRFTVQPAIAPDNR
jgi:hypothetical protein